MNNRREEVRETLSPTLFCWTCATTHLAEAGRVVGSVCNALIPVLKCDAGHKVEADDNSIAGQICGYRSIPGGDMCFLPLQKTDEVGHCRGILRIKRVGSGVPRNDEY